MDPLNPLTEADLRGLVRDAIARARSSGSTVPAVPGVYGSARPQIAVLETMPGSPQPSAPTADASVTVHVHASQALFVLGPGGDADGNCVIEPAVRCTHCGYCQTLGH